MDDASPIILSQTVADVSNIQSAMQTMVVSADATTWRAQEYSVEKENGVLEAYIRSIIDKVVEEKRLENPMFEL